MQAVVYSSQFMDETQKLDFLPDLLEMLITSCSTSSSLPLKRRLEDLGKGTGLNDGLDSGSLPSLPVSVSSKLWLSASEPLFNPEVETWSELEEMCGLHFMSVAAGTGYRVT